MVSNGAQGYLEIAEHMPFAHSRKVTSLCISGDMLISGGECGTIRTWQFDQNQNKFVLRQTLEGHVREVNALALCGPRLYSGSADHTIRTWQKSENANEGWQCISMVNSLQSADLNANPPIVEGHWGAVMDLRVVQIMNQMNQQELHLVSCGLDNRVIFWKITPENPNLQFFFADDDYGNGYQGETLGCTSFEVIRNQTGQQLLLVGMLGGSIRVKILAPFCTVGDMSWNECKIGHSAVGPVYSIRKVPNLEQIFYSVGGDGRIAGCGLKDNIPTPQ